MTNIASLMICDVHIAMIVNPESANDDVVNGRRYFAPRVVTSALREQEMSNAWPMHHSKVRNNYNKLHLQRYCCTKCILTDKVSKLQETATSCYV